MEEPGADKTNQIRHEGIIGEPTVTVGQHFPVGVLLDPTRSTGYIGYEIQVL